MRARAEEREPIRGREYGKWMRTNRKVTVRRLGVEWTSQQHVHVPASGNRL
jgi:hypothetical protein